MKLKLFFTLFICGWLLTHLPVQAQQTIFNVPSADVTPKGRVFLEHESLLRPWDPGAYWLTTNYGAVGVGYHTEIDVTLYNVSSPPSHNISLGAGTKTVLPIKSLGPLLKEQLSKSELKFTRGNQIIIPLEGQNVGYWGYNHLSTRLPKLKTRITAGVSVSTKPAFGKNTIGFMGGVEQPVTKKLTLLADWYSGETTNGFFASGFSYGFPDGSVIYVGYQIPNSQKIGRSGLILEIAKLF